MSDHDGNTSNPYHPNPALCCVGCVFGGEHAEWCPSYEACILREVRWAFRKSESD